MTTKPGDGTLRLYVPGGRITSPRGPLDDTERDAALAICARATSKADAETLLAMCGLLRRAT